MKKENEIFNLATDIANCVPVSQDDKRIIRSTALKLCVIAIRAYRDDPSLPHKLEMMAEYSS